LYECPECESRFCDLNEHPEIDMSDFYKDITPVFDQKLEKTFIPSQYWEAQKSELIALFGRQPESVLDIGCCGGDFLMHFEPTCSREGIEQSPIGSTIAQKRGLTVHQGFIETVSIENKYDIVTAYAVLEHISNPMSVLNKLVDFVKKPEYSVL
jgi:2-polyprenyl-3-methyl-5-hydroxy-6-metoxy-1,4-benzoquinol methylase